MGQKSQKKKPGLLFVPFVFFFVIFVVNFFSDAGGQY
jgi:hypothetical protein